MKCTSADIICICQVILNTHWYLILNFIYIYQHIKALFFQILFDFIYLHVFVTRRLFIQVLYRSILRQLPPVPFPSSVADRGYRSQRSSVLVDHHGLERLRRRHAVVVLRFAHVLRDQTDHVAAERQERQNRQRHLKRRLHRTPRNSRRRRYPLQRVGAPLQSHGVRRARPVVYRG